MGVTAKMDSRPYTEFRVACLSGCHAYGKAKAYTAGQVVKAEAKAVGAAVKTNIQMLTEPGRMKDECYPYDVKRRDVSGWHRIAT